MEAARKRPEIASVVTTFIPNVPQVFADVDRDKVLKQGVDLGQVYKTLQAFMGGSSSTTSTASAARGRSTCRPRGNRAPRAENVGQFYVRNSEGDRCRFRRW